MSLSSPINPSSSESGTPIRTARRSRSATASPVSPTGGVPEAVENFQLLRKSIGTSRMSSGSPLGMSRSLSRACPTSVIQVSVGPGIPFPAPAHFRRRTAIIRVTRRQQAAKILDQDDEVESLHSNFCPFNNGRFESFIELTQAGKNRGCTTREVGGNERKQWAG